MRTPSRHYRSFLVLLSGAALGAAVSGCSLKMEEQARVRVSFPAGDPTARSGGDLLGNGARGQSFLVGQPAPATLDDFTCFGINVTGPEISVNPAIPSCGTPNMPYPGVIGGLAPVQNGTLEVLVPAGPDRTFQLFAVKSRNGICPPISDTLVAQFGGHEIDVPLEIGRAMANVLGDTEVVIKAAYDPANPKPLFCPAGSGVPVKLAIVGSATPGAFQCAPYRIELRDKAEALATSRYELTVALSGTTSAQLFSDAACGSSLGSQSLSFSGSDAFKTFYFKAGGAGPFTLGASALGLASATLTVSPPASSQLSLAWVQAPAGDATGFSAQARVKDSFNNTVVTGTHQITLSAYLDPACTVAAGEAFALPSNVTADANPVASSAGVASFSGVKPQISGTFYLQASAPGLIPVCSAALNLPAGGATQLRLVGEFRSTVSQCSQELRVRALGFDYRPVTVGANLSVTLSGGAGTYYSDPACATELAGGVLTIPSGSSEAGFWYRGATQEGANMVASASGLVSAQEKFTVATTQNSPAEIEVRGPLGTAAGSCSEAFTIRRRSGDYNDATSGVTTVNLSSTGSVQFFPNATCSGGAITSASIPDGQASTNVYVKSATPGVVFLTAQDASGILRSKPEITLILGTGAPTRFIYFNDERRPWRAGNCSGIGLIALNDANLPVAVPAGATLNLTGSTGVQFYDEENECDGTPITATAFPPGGPVAMVRFIASSSGLATITATGAVGSGLGAFSLGLQMLPATPSRLRFSGPSWITNGECALFTLTAQDDAGTARLVPAATITQLGSMNGGSFYAGSDTTCSQSVINSLTFPAGQSAQTFRYRSTNGGDAWFYADAFEMHSDGSFMTSVGGGAATGLQFVAGAYAGPAGGCIGPMTVKPVDSNRAYTTAPRDIDLTLIRPAPVGQSPTGYYYSDAGCTNQISSAAIPSGQRASPPLYYKDPNPNMLTVRAQDIAATGSFGTASASVLLGGNNPVTSITLGPVGVAEEAVTASSCAYRRVATRDTAGKFAIANPSAGTTVNLSATGNLKLYANGSCSGPEISTIEIPANSPMAEIYIRNDVNETATITASAVINGATITGTSSSLVFSAPGVPAKLVISGPGTQQQNTCASYSILVQDTNSTARSLSASITVSLSGSDADRKYYSTPGCAGGTEITGFNMSSGSSTAQFYFRATTTGSFAMNVGGTGLVSAGRTVTITPPAAFGLAWNTSVSFASSGACIGPFSVTSVDQSGTPIAVGSDTAVNLTPNGASGSEPGFFDDNTCANRKHSVTILSGFSNSESVYFRSYSANGYILNATHSSGQLGPAFMDFYVVSSTSNRKLVIEAPRETFMDSCVRMRVRVGDSASGMPALADEAITIGLGGLGNAQLFTDPGCTTPGGISTIPASAVFADVWLKDGTPELLNLNASGTVPSATAIGGGNAQLSVFSPGGASRLAFVGIPQAIGTACSGPYYVESRNNSWNPAAVTTSVSITLSTPGSPNIVNADCSTPKTTVSISSGQTQSDGFYLTSSGAQGEFSVSAQDQSGYLSTAYQSLFVAGSDSPTHLLFMGVSDGATFQVGSCNMIRVAAKDDLTGPVFAPSDVTVSLTAMLVSTASNWSGQYYSQPDCVAGSEISQITIETGLAYKYVYFKHTVAEAVDLVAIDQAGTNPLVNATVSNISFTGP